MCSLYFSIIPISLCEHAATERVYIKSIGPM